MKQKVLNVSYRKDSVKFDEWMKYEIEILNEDGTTEIVPAYGKDLQDALSRVVHDKKVGRIESTIIKKVPSNIWLIVWFLGMNLIISSIYFNVDSKYVGFALVSGVAAYIFTTLSVSNWFRIKNTDK